MTPHPPTVHLSAEIAPWSRKGGLGDAVDGVTSALAGSGADAAVLAPLFEHTRLKASRRTEGEAVDTPDGATVPTWTWRADGGRRVVDFVELSFPYAFDQVHTEAAAVHQAGLDPRYILFGKVCALRLARTPPGVCFTHDWHGAAVHLYRALCPDWRFVHVIHNYEYQGPFTWGPQVDGVLGAARPVARRLVGDRPPSFSAMAIAGSDRVVTVSPAYAAEIRSGQVAHPGLSVLADVPLLGLLNGYDARRWDPRTDPFIVSTFAGPGPRRERNREHLVAELELDPGRPLAVMVSRLTEQKGIDLLVGSPPDLTAATARIDEVLACGVDIVVCGDPDGGAGGVLDRTLTAVASRRPRHVAYLPGYDDRTGHRLLAAADILIHPSRFEPCGLTQLHALAYGALPIVNPVGGLRSTVADNLDPRAGPVGHHLHEFSLDALVEGLVRCREALASACGADIVRRAMNQPQSWDVRHGAYLDLVDELCAAS